MKCEEWQTNWSVEVFLRHGTKTIAGVGLLLAQSLPVRDVQHCEVEEGRIQAMIRATPLIFYVYVHNSGTESDYLINYN